MTAPADYLALLMNSVGPSPTAQRIVDALVPEFADLAQVFVSEGDRLRIVAFRHIDPEQHPVLEQLAAAHRPSIDDRRDPVAQVLRSGEPRMSTWIRREQVETITSDARVHSIFDAIRPRNVVVVPLERAGERYGALVMALSSSGRRFIEGDLEFFREFAARVGPEIAL
jgi:GAF domain-containing protein